MPLEGGDDIGGDVAVDLDRIWLGDGAGDGEAEALLKGCARHRGPFCAGALISKVQHESVNTELLGYTRILL
jgi:hypothetical protein